jgi:hypothetical protein
MRQSLVVLPILLLLVSCSQPGQSGHSSGSVGEVRIEGQLDPHIPSPDPDKYKSVQDGRDWRNPYISIQGDGIHFLVSRSPVEWNLIQADELSNTLMALPLGAWPYGKVVAVVDGGGPQSGTAESRRRNRAKAQEILESLGVTINWWPGA